MQSALKKENHYTYADFCTWPEDERWEIIDGVVYSKYAPYDATYAKASPVVSHQSVLFELAVQLRDFLKGHKCKVFIAPVSVRLNADTEDNTVVEPDILVVCDESKIDGKGVVGAPDFIAEVLSPSTARYDKITKCNLYQRSGVREYWIVDPDRKTVTAHTQDDGANYVAQTYDKHDTAVPVGVLENCTINLTDVFGD